MVVVVGVGCGGVVSDKRLSLLCWGSTVMEFVTTDMRSRFVCAPLCCFCYRALEDAILAVTEVEIPETLIIEQAREKFAIMMTEFKDQGQPDEQIQKMITKEVRNIVLLILHDCLFGFVLCSFFPHADRCLLVSCSLSSCPPPPRLLHLSELPEVRGGGKEEHYPWSFAWASLHLHS